jgi:putative membrane protein
MALDPKVAYWTAALANMVAVVVCAVLGVRRIRRAEISAHRRLMTTAAILVGLFLLSYVAKVALLGREPLELWEPRFIAVLRLHETCVAVMVLAGARALYLATARRLADPPVPDTAARRARTARSHRRAGWTAIVSSALGVVTAGYVLYGMYARMH